MLVGCVVGVGLEKWVVVVFLSLQPPRAGSVVGAVGEEECEDQEGDSVHGLLRKMNITIGGVMTTRAKVMSAISWSVIGELEGFTVA